MSKVSTPNNKIWELSVWGAMLTGIIVLLAVGCVDDFSGPTETRQDSFSVGDSPRVVVNSTNGRIFVRTGDEGMIDVTADLRKPDRLDYQLALEGDTLTIIAESRQSKFEFSNSPGANITITVPPNTQVDLRTSNGSIEVQGIQRSATLRTSNGRIVLSGVKGEFEARTSNGSIEFSGDMVPGGANELRTSNGSISVTFTDEPNVDLDASTSNGRVISRIPITATRTDTTHLTGTIGKGEAQLIVRTSNGSVTIQ